MALSPYQQLQEEFAKAQALEAAAHYLRFDAETQMPAGVAADRGEQLAALELERHALLAAPKIARLIDRAMASTHQLDALDIDNLERMRRVKDCTLALPKSLLVRRARASAKALAARRAYLRGEDEQSLFSALAELLALAQDRAALLAKAFNLSPEDSLLDEIHPGLTRAQVEPLLKSLSNRLPELNAEQSAQLEVRSSVTQSVSETQLKHAISHILKRLPVPLERIQIELGDSTQVLSKVPGDYRLSLSISATEPWVGLRMLLGVLTDALHHHALPHPLQRQPVSTERSRLLRTAERYFWGQRWSREPACWQGFNNADSGVFWAEHTSAQLLAQCTQSGASETNLWSTTEWGFFAKAHVFYDLDQRLFDGELKVNELLDAYRDAQHRLPALMAADPDGVISEALWVNGEWFRPIQWLAGAALSVQVWELIKAEQEQLLAAASQGDVLSLWHWWREQVETPLGSQSLDTVLTQLTGRALSAQPIFRHFEPAVEAHSG